MGLIAQETVQEILDKVDIVSWIEQHVPLKKAGSDWKGLCPFHNENTPSFHVTPAKQSFYCFGCHAGGDLIGFVMRYENLSFPEAARRLADSAGIVITEAEADPEFAAKRKRRDRILKLQQSAAEFFHRLLLRHRIADPAREYLRGRRIGIDIAREWMLGYAPENRLFFDWATGEGFSAEELVEGGLAAWRDESQPRRGTYAVFRHRLMFPVHDENGSIIAFSGRVLEKDQKGGKYVNSPETPVFNKSRTFYGFHKSRRPITKTRQAIICEGQIDLIAAHHAGIENIVAPLGTAFTEHHAKVIRRQADEAVLCFDSDNAGLNAAGKAFRILAPQGLLVRLALLPLGHDPDSFIRDQGVDAFRAVLDAAPDYFDFHIDRKESRLRTGPLRDRLAFARELATDIALVEDKMLQDSLINRIALKLEIGEGEIRKQVASVARIRQRSERNRRVRENQEQSREHPDQASRRIAIENRSIRLLCHLLLNDPETKQFCREKALPDYFRDVPETEILARLWTGTFDPASPSSVHSFLLLLPDAEREALHRIREESFPGANSSWVEECLAALKKQARNHQIRTIKTRLGAPGLPADEVNRLTKELLDLQSVRNDIPEV